MKIRKTKLTTSRAWWAKIIDFALEETKLMALLDDILQAAVDLNAGLDEVDTLLDTVKAHIDDLAQQGVDTAKLQAVSQALSDAQSRVGKLKVESTELGSVGASGEATPEP